MKKSILLPFLFTFFCFLATGQERRGNIVEYFGKEKVEEINEGKVFHVFQSGLIQKKRNFPSQTPSVASDPVLAAVIENGGGQIEEGKTEGKDFSGVDLKWENIQVDENNEFNDDTLRSGYLYLEYGSASEKSVIFEASGHTQAIINGLPHEGDHYDFGWSLIPVNLKKGKNEFLLTGGRFNRMRARLLEPEKPIQFTTRDQTMPDVLIEENEALTGAIRIINSGKTWIKGSRIIAKIGENEQQSDIPSISPLNVRKVPFKIPHASKLSGDEVQVYLRLEDSRGNLLDTETIELNAKSIYQHHKKTFISDVDGSVQYYSIAPSLDRESEKQALFLSVHGASVEAVNQANAYKQKDWGHLVAPTNRRPFGFAWEDWGRLDALEVLSHAENLLKTDPQRTYLTGHSMGGHGTWYLGVTYPDKFAAIAPAAGYPDLLEYRHSFARRLSENPEEYTDRFGMSKADILNRLKTGFEDESHNHMDAMVRRAGNPSRTLLLENNYLHFGIYVLHGEIDSVVPTFIAREMRERLGKFHNDFAYYEYPDGTHWYGDHSVDWPPIFYFFKNRKIKEPKDIGKIQFTTASPGVSAGSHFITVLQQEKPFELSHFNYSRKENEIDIRTKNVKTLSLNLKKMVLADSVNQLIIDEQAFVIPSTSENIFYKKNKGEWEEAAAPSKDEKGPHRNGGFKDAFNNNVVFVYATKGSREENEWYYNRARFDAEKFWYRANGNIEIIKDTDFNAQDYQDRNVILYGNSNNNAAWKNLMKNSPVQVSNNKMIIGKEILEGDQWGAYFIVPRKDSEVASIGVVTATGGRGMKGAYSNDYLENGTFFPDLMIFDDTMIKNGISGIKVSGFFGNAWDVETGDFSWGLENHMN